MVEHGKFEGRLDLVGSLLEYCTCMYVCERNNNNMALEIRQLEEREESVILIYKCVV